MSDYNYWKISLESIFDQHGLKLTEEIIKDISEASELEYEYSGIQHIKNYSYIEKSEKENNLEKIIYNLNKKIINCEKEYARKRNIDFNRVSLLDDGSFDVN